MTCFDSLVNDSNSHMWRVLFWVVCRCVFFIFSADVSAEHQIRPLGARRVGIPVILHDPRSPKPTPFLSLPNFNFQVKFSVLFTEKCLAQGQKDIKEPTKDPADQSCLIMGPIFCFELKSIFDFILSPAVSWDQIQQIYPWMTGADSSNVSFRNPFPK